MRKGSPESANTLPKNKQMAGSGTEQKKKWHSTETSLIVSINGHYARGGRQEKANSYYIYMWT